MREQGYFGLTTDEVNILYQAIKQLEKVNDILSSKIVEIELDSGEKRKRYYENKALNKGYEHIDYAIDYIRNSIHDLKKI